MDYYMAALDLAWDPDDVAQGPVVADQIVGLSNVAVLDMGMKTPCLSVGCWDPAKALTPVATFLVIDMNGKAPVLLDEAFNAVLVALNLEQDIVLLARQGREDRIGRT